MSKTQITGSQIFDGGIGREDLNTATSGKALITKLKAGAGMAISSTGADSGTGDVTLGADYAILDTRYLATSVAQGQNKVFAAPSSGSGSPSFRYLVAGDIPTLNQNTTGNANSASVSGRLTNDSGTNSNQLQYWNAVAGDLLPTQNWWYNIRMGHGDATTYYSSQLSFDFFSNTIKYQRREGGVLKGWVDLMHSGNIGSQSVNYATTANYANSAGTATVANSVTYQAVTNALGYIPFNPATNTYGFITTNTGGCNWSNVINKPTTVAGYAISDIANYTPTVTYSATQPATAKNGDIWITP